ncbi:MAG: hypothetical protein DHS20C15_34590 [Planctomycetota bacterium]|nr:MAG: hypothetical protein DHS20C15_34590 [Planctomycetota bacterium]
MSTLPFRLALALCVCAFPACDEAPVEPPPEVEPTALVQQDWPADSSVIFVLIDTLRADHTSLVEHRLGRDTTPFLREIASESFVFQRHYVNATWTRASMASVFSSRLPRSHGCETRDGLLVEEIVTWPEVLQENGWQTRAVVTNGNVLPAFGFGQGFDDFEHVRDHPRHAYSDAWKVREPMLRAVDHIGSDKGMVWLHYVDPHDPYMHHDDADYNPDYHGSINGTLEVMEPYNWAPPPAADRDEIVDLYDGEILWFDHQLELLFERLEKRGLLERSWVVVTSDHGEGLWDHRIRAHGQEVFEEQVHVPLVIRPPGGLAARQDIHEPIAQIDVGPTLLDLLGQPIPPDFEGHSWADVLRGEQPAPARPVIIHELLDFTQLYAIIDGHEKLILDRDPKKGSIRLYDLVANPSEDVDRALDLRERRSSSATRLLRMLEESIAESAARRPAGTLGGMERMSPELEAELKALGYLGDGPPDEESDGAPTAGPAGSAHESIAPHDDTPENQDH